MNAFFNSLTYCSLFLLLLIAMVGTVAAQDQAPRDDCDFTVYDHEGIQESRITKLYKKDIYVG